MLSEFCTCILSKLTTLIIVKFTHNGTFLQATAVLSNELYQTIKPTIGNYMSLIIPGNGPFEEKCWQQSSIFLVNLLSLSIHEAKTKSPVGISTPNIYLQRGHSTE